MSQEPEHPQQQIAVWYFVAATFASVIPTMLFDTVEIWVRIAFLVVALALMVAGGIQLGREIRERRERHGRENE